ncbi:MAG: hypothetical protein QOI26_331, partial [Pseudonocardiales bacterium]|nr:hypothetical protein [Pseudonocardiales bacterium]
MFDTTCREFAAWVADVPEPDWSEHPVYSAMVPAAERLAELLELAPAARPTGELARMDARSLPAGGRHDQLAVLQEQKNGIDAVQAQVLAEIAAADSTALKLSQEAVSLALKVPVPTAQAKLHTGRTLVGELPKTLRLLARGVISARHAEVITETAWKLEPELVSAFEDAVIERAQE